MAIAQTARCACSRNPAENQDFGKIALFGDHSDPEFLRSTERVSELEVAAQANFGSRCPSLPSLGALRAPRSGSSGQRLPKLAWAATSSLESLSVLGKNSGSLWSLGALRAPRSSHATPNRPPPHPPPPIPRSQPNQSGPSHAQLRHVKHRPPEGSQARPGHATCIPLPKPEACRRNPS